MARSIQRSVDGVSVDEFHARFKGTVPLEEPELPSTAFDEVGVYIIVARAGEVTARQDRKGNVHRIAGLTVTDARVIEGELKTILVERLGLYGSDTDTETPSGQLTLPFTADPETGEVPEAFVDITDEVDELRSELEQTKGPEGIVGSIHSRSPEAAAAPKSGGLKVVPFRVDEPTGEGPQIDSLNERETVGQIRQSKDPALLRFLEGEEK